MKQHLVHFWDETPSYYVFAEDPQHAVEQALNAYPDKTPYSVFECTLVWHSKISTEEYEEEVRQRVIDFARK